jgi:uncharacterized membrane protein (UPF0127 family)
MNSKALLPIVLLMLLGCQEGQSKSTLVVEPTKTESNTTGTKESTEQAQKDPRYKLQRIHQLADLESRKMKVGATTLSVWLMDDDSKREEGMMWLTDSDVKDTEGMLFIFGDAQERGFWMQNCPLGLDICYIDPKGKVISVAEGKPYREDSLPSKGKAQYVLELKVGRAKKFGIRPGTVLQLPQGLKPKDSNAGAGA